MKLLSKPQSNPKLAKNIKFGVLTAPLHLAPYDISGFQVCPMASKGCAAACLNTAGRGKFDKTQQARIRKTLLYFNDRENFMKQLVNDISALERKANREGLVCGVRLNATSDIPWERVKVKDDSDRAYNNVMEMFPDVVFYDYTKRYNRKNLPSNYHLTFSLAEDNLEQAKKAIKNGLNVAVVFRTKDFPKEFLGLPVIDGDEHDYRPIDPKGCVVGLVAKGDAKKDVSGFVQEN